MRHIIHTDKAPQPGGVYSQGVSCGELVFTAGQVPINPATGQLIEGDFSEQVMQVLHNLSGVLSAAGSSLDQVIKFTVFVTDLDEFAQLNKVFEQFFADSPPARSVVEVAALPLGAQVEIEAVAVKEGA